MALATSRPGKPPAFFATWTTYLNAWKGSRDTTFCRAITAIYDPVVKDELETINRNEVSQTTASTSETDRNELKAGYDADKKRLRTRDGFPWITPILGSGCLSLSESSAAPDVEEVPKVLAALADSWGHLPEGTSAASAIEQVALSLVGTKLGAAAADRASRAEPTPETIADPMHEIAARALLCARLLTRLYFEAGAAAGGGAVNNIDTITFPTALDGDLPRGAEIQDFVVDPLKDQLQRLAAAVKARGDQDAFTADFAEAVHRDLTSVRQQVTVRSTDAILMGEIAWYFMTKGTAQYPGWSDLLTQLTLASDSAERSHRWPHLNDLSEARSRLHDEILQTTITSWATRVEAGSPAEAEASRGNGEQERQSRSGRDDLYDAVAELLIAQASRHSDSVTEGLDQWPPAVAFVTSFDLELEMALMKARSPFRLVVPFYARDTNDIEASAKAFVWLETVIEAVPPQQQLAPEDLYRLRVTRHWRLLTTHPDATTDDFTMPIVVRVAGSPLIKVAGIDELAEDEQLHGGTEESTAEWIQSLKESIGGEPMTLGGTVLLDEYTALHQWAAELATPPLLQDTHVRLGLQNRLFKGGNDTDARFWLVLGVQLSDESVRHRTAAVVSTADLRSTVNGPKRKTERAGLVVNRRTSPNERDVFLWQGLDVVAANYEEVVPALRHMAKHTADPTKRRFVGEPCAIDGGPE